MSIDVPQLILVSASQQTTERFEALLIDEIENGTFTCVPDLNDAAKITFAGQRAIIFWVIPAALAEDVAQQTQMGQIAQHAPLILLAPNQLEPLAQSLSQELAHDYLLLDELSASLLRRTIRHASRLFAAQQTDSLASTTTALAENVSNFTALSQTAPDAMVLSDKNGYVLQANEAYCNLYSYPREAVVGRPFYIIFPQDRHEWAMAEYKRVFANPQTPNHFESIIQRADGSERIVDTRIGFIEHKGERLAMLSTIRDITERAQTEQQLRQHIEFIDGLTAAMPGLVFVFDIQRQTVSYLNQAGETFLGYSLETLPVLNLELALKKIHPDDWSIINTSLQQIAEADNKEVLDCSFRLRQQDGRYQYIQCWQRILNRDATGVPKEIIGCLYDITANKESEAELRKLSHVIEQSPVSVMVTNINAEIEYVNPRFTQVTGYTLDEVLGQNPNFLKSNKTPQATYKELWQTLTAGRVWCGEFLNKKKNNELFWEEVSISPVLNDRGEATNYVAIKEDITERKLLEKQARYQERLASVGQLAAGIAHDFNNILAVIMLYSQLMQTAENLDSRHKSRLNTIIQQATRASELIQQILDFSRQTILEKRPLDMVAVTEEMVRMLSRTMPENILLKIDHDAELYTVNADPTRIQQILMNLCVNARDAMPQGGALTIELRHLLLEAGRKRPLAEMDNGSWVCIKISDTGIGIAEENLTHIFDPFFTTKQPGQGTGLGLAQVYGIVKQHDGHIRVDSVVGQGTHFFIYFPALFFSSMIQLNANINTLHSGSGQTILIVEDEKIMRQTLADVLLKLGYQTIMAKDGVEALETLAQVEHVDLILSDMVMPRMGGAELLQNLYQQQISLPVIILSGYAFHEDMSQLRQLGMKGWLPKPPNLEQLSKLIYTALA